MQRRQFVVSAISALTVLAGALAMARPAPPRTAPKPQALSRYEVSLIQIYTGTGYEFINPYSDTLIEAGFAGLTGPMVASSPSDDESNLKFYLQLKKAMAKLPPHKGEVYRGIYSHGNPEQRYVEGKVYSERRFQSATLKKDVAESFANGAYDPELRNFLPEDRVIDPRRSVMITIRTLTGRNVTKLSKKPEEAEVLLMPAIFKIVSAKRDGGGRFNVLIEELDPTKLSDADKAGLEHSEKSRLERIRAKLAEWSEPSLEDLVRTWNGQHARWKKTGYLDKQDLSEEMFMGGD